MGFLDMFRAFGSEKLPDVPAAQDSDPDLLSFGLPDERAVLAEAVDADALLQMFGAKKKKLTKAEAKEIPVVAAALNLITGTMHRLPVRLFRRRGDEVEEITEDPRTHLLNVNPGDTLTSSQMLDALIEDYYLLGGGYCYIQRSLGRVTGLYYVEHERVAVTSNQQPIFKDFNILVDTHRFLPMDFLKVLRATRDGATGEGLLERNNLLMQVVYHTMEFENALVSRGGNKKGVVTAQKKLSPDAKEQLRTDWKRMYSSNDESTIILNDGLDFKEISASSVELQLNENKKSNNLALCELFCVPEGMLTGCGTSSASEDDKTKFVDFCILPLAAALENAFNRDLLTLDEQRTMFFKFDTDELVKGKLLDRMRAYEIAMRNNVYQLDDVRKKENMKPLRHDSLQLSLASVLYNPKTKQGFVPNSGQSFDMTGAFGAEEGDTEE